MCVYYIFGLEKLLLASYTHCHSCKLEFLSNLGSEINPSLFGAYRPKYHFALVCRFIFCYSLEFYLYILNTLELAMLLGCKLSTFATTLL